MEYFKSSKNKIPGTSFSEVRDIADEIFRSIKRKSKRTPYVRSKYFNKEKIFLTIFWQHFFEKNERDRIRRLKFYDCAIDLIVRSAKSPISRENFKNKDELLHRFYGISKDGSSFVVQVKENKRTKRKDLVSIYPES